MDDDSNLNKNEFTALVSFAVNFHISHAQLVLSDLSLQCSEEGRATGGGFKGKGRRRNQRPAANNLSPERSFRRLLEGSLCLLEVPGGEHRADQTADWQLRSTWGCQQ